MQKLFLLLFVFTMALAARAQTPKYACFGAVVFIDSAGVSVTHHVRSNVFEISHFLIDFSATPEQWQDLTNRASAEANKQLMLLGDNMTVFYPIVLSNYADQQKTQDALDIWDSRTPPDILVQFK